MSAVLSVWGRTPATLAMTAATLYRLAQGRYVLGLGTSTRALVEGFHDVAFTQPADKLREVTTKVRVVLDDTPGPLDVLSGRVAPREWLDDPFDLGMAR